MGARGLWVSFPCFPAVSGLSGTFQWILATSYLSLSSLNELTVSLISCYAGGGESDRGADAETRPRSSTLSARLSPMDKTDNMSAIAKAKQHKFWLGLDSEYGWLDAL